LDASSNEQFDVLLSSKELKDIWKTCGFLKPIETMKFEDKKKMIDIVVLHFTIVNSLAEIEQLHQGLAFLKFDRLMKSHTDLIITVFRPSQSLNTASYLQDEFRITLSPKGSVKRTAKEGILILWYQYLENVEGKHFYCETNCKM